MKIIGLISDTHGYLHPGIIAKLQKCDEIWHAGDVGSLSIIEQLHSIAPLKAVFGNIDDQEVRLSIPKNQVFTCEGLKIFMTHIGGYPGKYAQSIQKELTKEMPGIMVAGHSHILKVMYDKKNDLLYINPGAAGISGMHNVITMIRFTLDKGNISNMEVIEFPRQRV